MTLKRDKAPKRRPAAAWVILAPRIVSLQLKMRKGERGTLSRGNYVLSAFHDFCRASDFERLQNCIPIYIHRTRSFVPCISTVLVTRISTDSFTKIIDLYKCFNWKSMLNIRDGEAGCKCLIITFIRV